MRNGGPCPPRPPVRTPRIMQVFHVKPGDAPRWAARPAQGRRGCRSRPAGGRGRYFFARSRTVEALPCLRRAARRGDWPQGPTPEPAGRAGCFTRNPRAMRRSRPRAARRVSCVLCRNLRAHRMGRARPCSRPTAAGSDTPDRAAHPAAAALRCGARRPGCLDVSRGTGGSVPAFAGSGHPAVVSDGGGAAVPADCRLSIRLARFHVRPRRSSAALLLSPADPDARTGRMFHVEPEVVSGGTAPSDSDARTGPSRKRAQRSAPALRSSPPDAHSLQVLGGAAPVLEGRRRETRTFGRGGCFTWNRRPCLVRRRPGT